MKSEFHSLYETMAGSHNVAFMRVFGNVHKEMMDWMILNKPDIANEFIEKLEAIRWKQYLTEKEALTIVSKMIPKPIWSMDVWRKAMDLQGWPIEESPCYNCNALYAVMSMVYSDSYKTIAKLMGKSTSEVTNEEWLAVTRALALDKLKDEDGVFKVREYFGV